MIGIARRLVVLAFAFAAFLGAAAEQASAVQVQCVEASKYKYLYALFGGDRRKFAAYLEIDAAQHPFPDPEACRAVLVSGGIGGANDRDMLLDQVIANKGWLAQVYLNSGGGSVWVGQQLGYIVRTFRLKTFTAYNQGSELFYQPDFLLPPLSAEWAASLPAPAALTDAERPKGPVCALNEHVPAPLRVSEAAAGIVRPEVFRPTYDQGIDRPGGDYRRVGLTSADPVSCQRACLGDAKCRAWAYRNPSATPDHRPQCSLKQSVLARIADANSISGIARDDTPDATYEENTSRGGASFKEFNLPRADARLCQKACLDDTRCRIWNYRKPEGRTDGLPHCALREISANPTKDGLAVAGTVTRLQYTGSTYDENLDRRGPAYREFDLAAADPKLCQRTCLGQARCRAWSYRKPEGRTNHKAHCALEEHVGTQAADGLNISGIILRTDHFEPDFEADTDRPGVAYRSVAETVPEPGMCRWACTGDAKCRAWSYQPPNTAYLVSLASGWDLYRKRQQSVPSTRSPSDHFCASSCVQVHVAGMDRTGVVQVHRPNQGFSQMSQQAQNLNYSDADMPQFYQFMDAGPRITRLMQQTSATTVTPTRDSRFPRYVLDYLIVHCESDPEQLQNLETQLEVTLKELARPGADMSLKVDTLRTALAKLHEKRQRVEQCVARNYETDRLAAFGKLCEHGCDRKKLSADFDAAVNKIHAQNR
jgi:hypothetical protein